MNLKEKFQKKELTIGSWLSFGFTPIVEMMSKSDFEWLVIDMEHTGISTFDMFQMIQIISLSGASPLVRVGKNDELLIKKAMDSGAEGVIVPMINSKDDAQKAVEYTKYPPKGVRGTGLSRAHKYGLDFDGYKQWVDNNSIVIVQIEHIKAVDNLNEIMAVDGVDGFIVGPYDLSASLGVPGDFSNTKVKEALNQIVSFMQESTKPGGFHIVHSDSQLLDEKINEGYRFLAYGDDMVFLAEKINSEKIKVENILKHHMRT